MGYSVRNILRFFQRSYSISSRGAAHIRISHSGSKAQAKGHTRNHGLGDRYVYVVFQGPIHSSTQVPPKLCVSTLSVGTAKMLKSQADNNKACLDLQSTRSNGQGTLFVLG